MALFYRSHAIFYRSAIVSIALSYTDVENIVTLKSGLEIKVIENSTIRRL